jgi:6-phosphogluconolactonase
MNSFFNTAIKETADAIVAQLAGDLCNYLQHALSLKNRVCIALSGGRTPERLFTLLADRYKDSIPWNSIHFFWVDERCVPVESDESNFGTAQRLLFSKVAISEENVHPAYTTNCPETELKRYIREIEMHVPQYNKRPCFDVMLLGMGADGHTASLFPGREDLFATDDVCALVKHPQTGQQRITLTGKVINNAREIVFLVTGSEKASRVQDVLKKHTAELLPARLVQPVHGRLSWYMDKDAAGLR